MASASEEKMSTIIEIARNTKKTGQISERAVIQANNTGEKP